jgi:hypothetical protein
MELSTLKSNFSENFVGLCVRMRVCVFQEQFWLCGLVLLA